MRLIDADELRDRVEYIEYEYGCINDEIDDMPTIDAVEIVRCKDCIHRLHLYATSCRPEQYLCRLDDRTFYPSRKANNPEWFCADGERKEE